MTGYPETITPVINFIFLPLDKLHKMLYNKLLLEERDVCHG